MNARVGREDHRSIFTWTPLSYLGMSTRFHSIARREGWEMALDFCKKTDAELLAIHGFGKDTLRLFREVFPAPEAARVQGQG